MSQKPSNQSPVATVRDGHTENVPTQLAEASIINYVNFYLLIGTAVTAEKQKLHFQR